MKSLAHRVLPVTARLRLSRLRHGEAGPLPAARRWFGKGRHDAIVVPRGFDAWSMRQEGLALAVSAWERAGIGVRVRPDLPPSLASEVHPVMVDLTSGRIGEAASVLAQAGQGWQVARLSAGFRAWRQFVTPDGVRLGGVELGLKVVGSASGGLAEAAPMGAPSIDPGGTGDTATGRRPAPTTCEVNEPLDIVYTWVDGGDPTWEAKRQAVREQSGGHPSASSRSRFTSHDELRYALRSLEMYAGWCRSVFIVTDDQIPAWLDVSHPRITVVDHTSIFDMSDLPTFNSHAIESRLHHIDGLSERYLYLNDDMFFGRPVQPELFFQANGVNSFFLSAAPIPPGPPTRDDLPVDAAAKYGRDLLQRRFGRAPALKFAHAPYPQSKAVLAEMEQDFPEDFSRVARSRFRHPRDISVPAAMQHYYAFERGLAVPGKISYEYFDLADPELALRLAGVLRRRHLDAFCVNEVDLDEASAAANERVLADFLAAYYPVPSSFERR